jgi:hypothetical protein
VYLAEVPEDLADALISVIGQAYWDAWSLIRSAENAPGWVDDEEFDADRVSIGPTFREQIVKARRGQGVFRANVLLHETCCRVTLVDDPRHLKASHIKPWRDAADNERLDGSNGFLLSPHIDHLFDQGYLTFSPDRRLLVVPDVRDRLIDAWGIRMDIDVGSFTREQSAYLDYHRANVFNRHRTESSHL